MPQQRGVRGGLLEYRFETRTPTAGSADLSDHHRVIYSVLRSEAIWCGKTTSGREQLEYSRGSQQNDETLDFILPGE